MATRAESGPIRWMWSTRLAFDAQGKVIAGTGNRGNIYRLDSDQSYTRLVNLEAAQVTGFAAGANGRLYAVTGNIGEIFSIGPEREPSGTLESDVMDAGAFSVLGTDDARCTPAPAR